MASSWKKSDFGPLPTNATADLHKVDVKAELLNLKVDDKVYQYKLLYVGWKIQYYPISPFINYRPY